MAMSIKQKHMFLFIYLFIYLPVYLALTIYKY